MEYGKGRTSDGCYGSHAAQGVRMRSAALTLCLLAGLAGGCQPRKPFVKVHDILIERVDATKLDLEFQFEVFNPNGYAIEMSALDFRLAASGRGFAAGSLAGSAKVEGLQSALLRVPASIEYRKLLVAAGQYLKGTEIPYELSGNAVFRAAGLTIETPVSHKGRIVPLRPPSLRVVRVRRARGELTTVELVLEVTNPNAFDIQDLRLKGTVTCNARPLLSVETAAGTALPAGRTVEVVIPVRLSLEGAAGAIAESMKGQPLKFEGDFDFTPHASLREMLLGQPQNAPEKRP